MSMLAEVAEAAMVLAEAPTQPDGLLVAVDKVTDTAGAPAGHLSKKMTVETGEDGVRKTEQKTFVGGEGVLWAAALAVFEAGAIAAARVSEADRSSAGGAVVAPRKESGLSSRRWELSALCGRRLDGSVGRRAAARPPVASSTDDTEN